MNRNGFSNFVDLLCHYSNYQPDQRAFIFLLDGEREEVKITYRELDQQSRAIAAKLQSICSPRERILLLYPSCIDYITAFLGCLYAGMIAIPVYPPRNRSNIPRIKAIIEDSKPRVILTTAVTLSKTQSWIAQETDIDLHKCIVTEDLLGIKDNWQKPMIDGNALCFIQYTSGSTSAPKGAMVSHSNILHNQSLIKKAFNHTEETVVVGWLPFYHDMGLIRGNILQPLYLGISSILMSPVYFIQRPYRWLQAISSYKATTSGGPNFAYELCLNTITSEQKASLDLSRWSVAFNGAEPIQSNTLKKFAEVFSPCGFRWEAFYPCYGMAEATLMISGGIETNPPVLKTIQADALERNRAITAYSADKKVSTVVGCGNSVLPDQRIIIVDPKTLTVCKSGDIGEIWVSSPSIVQGYWNKLKETEDTFKAYLPENGEGPFLRTGDLGFLHEGELFVTDRLKDLIIVRGLNYYPQDIEKTVECSHSALRKGFGAAFTVEIEGKQLLVIVQEVKRHCRGLKLNEVVADIRQSVTATHALQVQAISLVKFESIPKTSSGKIQRYACRTGFLNKTLNVIGEWIQELETATLLS